MMLSTNAKTCIAIDEVIGDAKSDSGDPGETGAAVVLLLAGVAVGPAVGTASASVGAVVGLPVGVAVVGLLVGAAVVATKLSDVIGATVAAGMPADRSVCKLVVKLFCTVPKFEASVTTTFVLTATLATGAIVWVGSSSAVFPVTAASAVVNAPTSLEDV
jgi:hypothetical protein